MIKQFRTGLVVGKFSPLHLGHDHVIRRARAECEQVFLISYSNPEFKGCEAAKREHWIRHLYPDIHHLALSETDVPANDADAVTHRLFCGRVCKEVFDTTVDAVFSSEDYGDGFAAELTRYFGHEVRHVLVDQARLRFPISGTLLRNDPHMHRQWLPPVVYASFVQRICLLGGESSGKSTLAGALATAFNTSFVPEYGRELWESKQGHLEYNHMRHIAEVQIAREEAAAQNAHRFLFCDTSPLTTLFYSQHLFGQCDPALEQMARRPYDLTLLCAPDFEFVQDGTRQPPAFRSMQHQWYLHELASRGIPYRLVSGSVEQRLNQIRQWLHTDLPEKGRQS